MYGCSYSLNKCWQNYIYCNVFLWTKAEKSTYINFDDVFSDNKYTALGSDEYIFDITTELANQKKQFYLIFQRTSWYFPLHRDGNELYTDAIYHTVNKK